MTPIEAIESVDAQLIATLNRKMADLRNEADSVALQWEGLKNVGGARDDHAAAILSCLSAHLEGLERFCAACRAQIDQWNKDPFGRESTE